MKTLKSNNNEVGIMTFLPPKALALICSFNMNEFRTMMGVCANWHFNIWEGFDEILKQTENSFVAVNIRHLSFKESYLNTQNIEFCGKKGLWVDWVICADVLPYSSHIGKTLKFGFTFCYQGDDKRYLSEYRLDIVKKRPRLLWMHYDQDN